MKTLYESLLDDFEDLSAPLSPKVIKDEIKQFLKDNYIAPSKFHISRKPNEDGFYEVEHPDQITFRGSAESLTNGKFVFVNCRSFSVQSSHRLKNLIGSPKETKFGYHIFNCNNLESLEGITEKTGFGYGLHISDCRNLKTLIGLPEKARLVNISYCYSLTDLTGSPKEVELDFRLFLCRNLDSLKGAPKKVGGVFCCEKLKRHFTEEEMKKVTDAGQYETIE
jgi:hypothetical protein